MSEPIIDTHSTMGPREYRRLSGLPEPPEGDGVRLTFTVTCRPSDEDAVKARVLDDLQSMGMDGCHYRREPCRA